VKRKKKEKEEKEEKNNDKKKKMKTKMLLEKKSRDISWNMRPSWPLSFTSPASPLSYPDFLITAIGFGRHGRAKTPLRRMVASPSFSRDQ
jgi:hypothetical protein